LSAEKNTAFACIVARTDGALERCGLQRFAPQDVWDSHAMRGIAALSPFHF
jgi:hypothetical protein